MLYWKRRIKMLIIISGQARVGKNVFAEFLAEGLIKQTGNTYVMMAYAHELKCMIQKEFDLSWDQLWGDQKEEYDKRYPKGDGFWTAREAMQQFGEFYRSIDPKFWTKKLFSIINDKGYENVIITDGRYPNEIDPVVEKGGYHIRISREAKDDIHGSEHSSETSLDDGFEVDIVVENNGTLDELKKVATETVVALINMEKLRRN
jgi:hypothetical protein